MSFTTTNVNNYVKIRESNDFISPETIVSAFQNCIEKYGDRKAMYYKDNNKWKSFTWREYLNSAKLIAATFIKLGLKRGEGVAIIGFNSYKWFLCNLAAIMAGGVSVGIYGTNSPDICRYIINNSSSKIVVVENTFQLNKIKVIRDCIDIKTIVQYNGPLDELSPDTFDWDGFMDTVHKIEPEFIEQVDSTVKKIQPYNCSTLIYTSGTTGLPKGVMLSHDNIIWTTKTVLETVGIHASKPQTVVSYLPLSHVAAQMIDIYMPLINGGCTWFAEPTALKGTLIETLKVAKPTIFMGVPRVWEKVMEKMQATALNISKLKKFIAKKAKHTGLTKHYREEHGIKKKPMLWGLWNELVYKKVKQKLGFSRCHLFLTGAAPIKMEVLEYFASLNMPLNNIYGMSECSGPMTLSYKNHSLTGSAGQALQNTRLKIDPITGEICTFGRHIMMGYLNNKKKTSETIDSEGWLHSGDIGKLDEKGFLHITGRIKELIVTSGGENIPPVLVENSIKKELPIVSNCMLIGDHRKFLTCLITLKCFIDSEGRPTDVLDYVVKKIFKKNNIITVSDAIGNKHVREYIQKGIDRVNENSISKAQKVQKFTILPVDFSMHGDELGPTLKLKRTVVYNKYIDLINSMYK